MENPISSLKGVCGLTHELVDGLIANLESREMWRKVYVATGLCPGNRRASSSDAVEGFVALRTKC